MSKDDIPKQTRPKSTSREDRLKQALKANLTRRKAQARVRGKEKPAAGKDDEA